MPNNETIFQIAKLQAQLIEKTAECTILRNKINAFKKQDKKPATTKPVIKPKATTKKPARKGVKSK